MIAGTLAFADEAVHQLLNQLSLVIRPFVLVQHGQHVLSDRRHRLETPRNFLVDESLAEYAFLLEFSAMRDELVDDHPCFLNYRTVFLLLYVKCISLCQNMQIKKIFSRSDLHLSRLATEDL